MKRLIGGISGVIVALLTSIMLVLTGGPANALDTVPPPAPPRLAPPTGNPVTIPSKPSLPGGVIGRGVGIGIIVAGLAELTKEWGSKSLSSSYICTVPTNPSEPLGPQRQCNQTEQDAFNSYPSIEALPDQWWGSLVKPPLPPNAGLDVSAVDTIVDKLPPTPNASTIATEVLKPVTWTPAAYNPQTGQTASGTLTLELTKTKGQWCVVNPAACQFMVFGVNPNDGTHSMEFRGQCRNSSGGTSGLDMQESPGTWLSSSTVKYEKTADGTPHKVTPCYGERNLDYLAWRDNGNNSYDAGNGIWLNPNYEPYKNTTITRTVNCKNGAGQTATVTKTTTGSGFAIDPVCPIGYQPDSGNTSVGGGLLTAPKKLEEWTITPQVREQYPECIGWQAPGCVMQVLVDGLPCIGGDPRCADWAEIWRTQPSRVKCFWGPYQMDMSQCMPLRNAYLSELGTKSDPKKVPGPADWGIDAEGNPLKPNPDPSFPTQPDPTTPTVPNPGGDPGTDPGTGTGTDPTAPWNNPAPIPNHNTNPGPPAPNGAPNLTPNSNDTNCWPGGTAAFNPLEWVLQPVKCALSWAFVPRQDVAQTQMTKVQNSFGKVPVVASIGTVTTAIGTIGGGAGGGTGCMGPQFQFDFQSVHETIHPFNACAEPVATMARITNALTTVVVIVLGVLGIVRAFGASVGFNFTMGKGGDS